MQFAFICRVNIAHNFVKDEATQPSPKIFKKLKENHIIGLGICPPAFSAQLGSLAFLVFFEQTASDIPKVKSPLF